MFSRKAGRPKKGDSSELFAACRSGESRFSRDCQSGSLHSPRYEFDYIELVDVFHGRAA